MAANFFQEKDGSFSLRRLLACLAFVFSWGGSLALAIKDGANPETKWIIMVILGFGTLIVLLLLGYTTMQDLKEIAKEIKGKGNE